MLQQLKSTIPRGSNWLWGVNSRAARRIRLISAVWDISFGTLNVPRSQEIIDVVTPEIGKREFINAKLKALGRD
jgi:hypothetical protein